MEAKETEENYKDCTRMDGLLYESVEELEKYADGRRELRLSIASLLKSLHGELREIEKSPCVIHTPTFMNTAILPIKTEERGCVSRAIDVLTEYQKLLDAEIIMADRGKLRRRQKDSEDSG